MNSWIETTRQYVETLSRTAIESERDSFFTIATTRKVGINFEPYLTPVRNGRCTCVGGIILFDVDQAPTVARLIDGVVDHIVVDAESKFHTAAKVVRTETDSFGATLANIENLSIVCSRVIKTSIFSEFKPNDITVETAWLSLSHHFKTLCNRNIAVIGGGNIGFKLSLKLLESEAPIQFVRRNTDHGLQLVSALNVIKPQATRANANFQSDALVAATNADALVGTSDGTPVIDAPMVQAMCKDGIVIDVGKGTITAEAINLAHRRDIKVVRTDVAGEVVNAMEHLLADYKKKSNFGRRKLAPDVWIVSGGYMGHLGDFVVDNLQEPQAVVGICDGVGDLKRQLENADRADLDRVLQLISD